MFEKVLVAEDHEMMNLSLRRTLEDFQIPRPDHAYYCNLTLSQIKKALHDGNPYDLLVTDLYFEVDGSSQQLPDGVDLIKLAKEIQPSLKILVFSAEGRSKVIQSLFDDLKIDGYVRKARGDAQELKAALERLAKNRRHYPNGLRNQGSQENLHSFTEYDKTIIQLLAEGYAQKDIPNYLSNQGISPSSLSSVEKRLNLIKTAMDFSKNEQLVAFCKEIRLI